MIKHYIYFALFKINKHAKDCNILKQSAYEQRDHEKVQHYKQLQNYLYLLKALTLLSLKESGDLELEKNKYIQKNTDAILLSFVSTDGSNFNFHSLCSNQEVDEKEKYLEFKDWNQDKTQTETTPLLGVEVYKRFLIKNLSPKYKAILDIFPENMIINLEGEALYCLSKNIIKCTGISSNMRWYGTEERYCLCMEGIKLCTAFGHIYDDPHNPEYDGYRTQIDDDGYLDYDMSWD